MVRRDSIPLPKLPPPRKITLEEQPTGKPTSPVAEQSAKPLSAPLQPLTPSLSASQISATDTAPVSASLNTEKEQLPTTEGSAEEEDEELNTANLDINVAIQREGSGLVLRRLLRATCRLSAAAGAGPDHYTPGHVSALNGRIKILVKIELTVHQL